MVSLVCYLTSVGLYYLKWIDQCPSISLADLFNCRQTLYDLHGIRKTTSDCASCVPSSHNNTPQNIIYSLEMKSHCQFFPWEDRVVYSRMLCMSLNSEQLPRSFRKWEHNNRGAFCFYINTPRPFPHLHASISVKSARRAILVSSFSGFWCSLCMWGRWLCDMAVRHCAGYIQAPTVSTWTRRILSKYIFPRVFSLSCM